MGIQVFNLHICLLSRHLWSRENFKDDSTFMVLRKQSVALAAIRSAHVAKEDYAFCGSHRGSRVKKPWECYTGKVFKAVHISIIYSSVSTLSRSKNSTHNRTPPRLRFPLNIPRCLLPV